jgi:hypothetical protein
MVLYQEWGSNIDPMDLHPVAKIVIQHHIPWSCWCCPHVSRVFHSSQQMEMEPPSMPITLIIPLIITINTKTNPTYHYYKYK